MNSEFFPSLIFFLGSSLDFTWLMESPDFRRRHLLHGLSSVWGRHLLRRDLSSLDFGHWMGVPNQISTSHPRAQFYEVVFHLGIPTLFLSCVSVYLWVLLRGQEHLDIFETIPLLWKFKVAFPASGITFSEFYCFLPELPISRNSKSFPFSNTFESSFFPPKHTSKCKNHLILL